MHNCIWAVTKSIAFISDILCYFIVLWMWMKHSLCFFVYYYITFIFLFKENAHFFLLNFHTKNLCLKHWYKIGFCSLYYIAYLLEWGGFCITFKFVQCYSLPGSIYIFLFIIFLDTREYDCILFMYEKSFDLKICIIILLHFLINILRKKAN